MLNVDKTSIEPQHEKTLKCHQDTVSQIVFNPNK
jgi:hypothetical protein